MLFEGLTRNPSANTRPELMAVVAAFRVLKNLEQYSQWSRRWVYAKSFFFLHRINNSISSPKGFSSAIKNYISFI